MGSELLVENRIEDGQRLLVELVRAGFDISAAAWLKISDERPWSLFIGSRSVDAGKVGDDYVTLYKCLQRIPGHDIDLSAVKLVPESHPVSRDVIAARDRRTRGRLPVRYGGQTLGNIGIDEAYIYPRVTPGLTRDEVLQTVTGLMSRVGTLPPSTVTLRDGTVVRGTPFGLEVRSAGGPASALEIKLTDDADGSTHLVPVDDVTNIQ